MEHLNKIFQEAHNKCVSEKQPMNIYKVNGKWYVKPKWLTNHIEAPYVCTIKKDSTEIKDSKGKVVKTISRLNEKNKKVQQSDKSTSKATDNKSEAEKKS